MNRASGRFVSDLIRQHAQNAYVAKARRQQKKTFSINVGEVHAAVSLRNRVPLVCQALRSEKFLQANALRLISTEGPPSGQSTTVTYTFEFVDKQELRASSTPSSSAPISAEDAWIRLRGAMKDIFAQLGGGEAYLQAERRRFYGPAEDK